MSVFLDTSALYALADAKDAHHAEARRIVERLKAEGAGLCVHEWIVLESVWLVQKRLGREAAVRLGLFFQNNPILKIHFLDASFLEEVFSRYENRHALGMVDAASLLLMERLGLSRAFSFDRGFAAAGFSLEKA